MIRRRAALKIDVCTREGMKHRVEPLLAALKRAKVTASFFLAFGPDCSGWAVKNLLDPRFRRKMAKSNALALYGWRTMFSGTLLPARPVAAGFPDLVRRIADEGHEVALHGWNHRRWQESARRMGQERAAAELRQAAAAFEQILGWKPAASGAPGWTVGAASLRAQDELGFVYASDLRGGPPCLLRSGGEEFATPQFPTTTLCIEELLASGRETPEELLASLLDALAPAVAPSTGAVLPIHAEVEGGPYLKLFEKLLATAAERGVHFVPLVELARALPREKLPVRDLCDLELAGRAVAVASSADPAA